VRVLVQGKIKKRLHFFYVAGIMENVGPVRYS
jgi:hypothetical protein